MQNKVKKELFRHTMVPRWLLCLAANQDRGIGTGHGSLVKAKYKDTHVLREMLVHFEEPLVVEIDPVPSTVLCVKEKVFQSPIKREAVVCAGVQE